MLLFEHVIILRRRNSRWKGCLEAYKASTNLLLNFLLGLELEVVVPVAAVGSISCRRYTEEMGFHSTICTCCFLSLYNSAILLRDIYFF